MKTETELRELDAWVLENVFGGALALTGATNPLKHYSTDPAAAMKVLEKCAESGVLDGEFKLPVSIFQRGDKQWVASENTEDEEECTRHYIVVEAETLPLAICLFAKKIYSK